MKQSEFLRDIDRSRTWKRRWDEYSFLRHSFSRIASSSPSVRTGLPGDAIYENSTEKAARKARNERRREIEKEKERKEEREEERERGKKRGREREEERECVRVRKIRDVPPSSQVALIAFRAMAADSKKMTP